MDQVIFEIKRLNSVELELNATMDVVQRDIKPGKSIFMHIGFVALVPVVVNPHNPQCVLSPIGSNYFVAEEPEKACSRLESRLADIRNKQRAIHSAYILPSELDGSLQGIQLEQHTKPSSPAIPRTVHPTEPKSRHMSRKMPVKAQISLATKEHVDVSIAESGRSEKKRTGPRRVSRFGSKFKPK
eukprot:gnl/Dysnectes_brevis/4125_a5432_772.p1 GENE.gnl/Dysnectes_brevis/4125_a5432_772~~gnl/Dysnectes_brevis/4125_a5432_772.p1  ORF type:complete len:185 (-),score=24.43 gnl/Dysnectes_brevis/4125_a5432_772:47-601(-)